jgi:hypothetical protein
MAREEVRLQKHLIMKRQNELTHLYLELEASEIDIDNLEVLEMDAVEGVRRDEISISERACKEEMSRLIRREKSHWRIASVRTKVIRKKRPRFQAIYAKVRSIKCFYFSTPCDFVTSHPSNNCIGHGRSRC